MNRSRVHVVVRTCGCKTHHLCRPVAIFSSMQAQEEFIDAAERAAANLGKRAVGTKYDADARLCSGYVGTEAVPAGSVKAWLKYDVSRRRRWANSPGVAACLKQRLQAKR